MRKRYDKLIRDRIPELMDAEGVHYETEVLSDEEFGEALREKVLEEAREVHDAAPEELAKEIGDLMEVVAALQDLYGIRSEKVAEVREKRRTERGGFERRLKLRWTEE